MRGQLGDVGKLLTWPSIVLTEVLAEICMSAGPNRVAPVSRPATHMMADIIRCSMNGRAMMISSGSHSPAAILAVIKVASSVFVKEADLALP